MPRENLKRVNGKRMRFVATLERFGTKRGWSGSPEQTLLLRDVVFADDDQPACSHLWFKAGVWSSSLKPRDRFEFCARVDNYDKGYHGGRAESLGVEIHQTDYHLERPSQVFRIAENVPILGSTEDMASDISQTPENLVLRFTQPSFDSGRMKACRCGSGRLNALCCNPSLAAEFEGKSYGYFERKGNTRGKRELSALRQAMNREKRMTAGAQAG